LPDFQRKIAESTKQNCRSSAVVIVRWDTFSKSEEYLEKHGKIHIYKMVKINSIYSEESKYENRADEGSEVIFMLVGFCDCIERWLYPENGFVSFPPKLNPAPTPLREDIPFQTH